MKHSKQAVRKSSKETVLPGESLNRAWTRMEESLLIEWREQGKSFVEIGAVLGRTDLAVACKYLELVPLPESESDCGVHQHSWEFNLKQKVPGTSTDCIYRVYFDKLDECSVHNGVLHIIWSLLAVSGYRHEAYCAICKGQTSPPANGHW